MMTAQRSSAPGQSEAFLTSMVENMPAVVFAKDSAPCRFILLNGASEIPQHSVRCHYQQDRPRFLSQGEGRPFIARDRRALQSRLPQRSRRAASQATPRIFAELAAPCPVLIGTGSAAKSFRLELGTFLARSGGGNCYGG